MGALQRAGYASSVRDLSRCSHKVCFGYALLAICSWDRVDQASPGKYAERNPSLEEYLLPSGNLERKFRVMLECLGDDGVISWRELNVVVSVSGEIDQGTAIQLDGGRYRGTERTTVATHVDLASRRTRCEFLQFSAANGVA